MEYFDKKLLLVSVVVLLANCHLLNGDGVDVKNPYFHFPYGSPFMGILTAFAVPLEIKGPADVFIAVNIEASYSVPENETSFVYPPIVGSSSTRQFVYTILESKLKSYGVNGRQCLLRLICETAQYSTAETGILGDLLHIILTPSSSINEDLLDTYTYAEETGKKKKTCEKYRKKCAINIYKVFSWIGNFYNKFEKQKI